MKRCIKCVLPETTPKIVFDEGGVCNFCHSYQKYQFKGESALRDIFDSVRGQGNKYDCIVGLSGGRDSTYTLLKLVKDYEMKVLAVNYDNPFTDPQAKKNIENAVNTLGVDLYQFRLKNGIHERTFKNNFLAWLKRPSAALVPMLCIACRSFFWEVIKIAKKSDIHCIVHGGNPFEDSSFKKELINISHGVEIDKTYTKIFPGVMKELLKNPRYFHPVCIPAMVKGYLFGNPYAPGSRFFARDMQMVDLFHYIEWNEDEILSSIYSELNWDCNHKFASTWRFDCKIGHLKDLLYFKTLQMTEKDEHYSQIIREGILSRGEALKRLENENRIYIDEILEISKQAGITDLSQIYNLQFLDNTNEMTFISGDTDS
jgi:hypothetical protein